MASYFLDSSALVKYYHTETGSAEVNRLIHALNARHYISRLITVEVASAFAVKTRTGDLDERDFVPLLRRFLRDVAQRQFQALRVTNAHYEAAVEVIEKYFQRRLRTLDVHFVSPAPVERHARVGGHPGPYGVVSWIPACAGMTRGHKDWQCIYEMDI